MDKPYTPSIPRVAPVKFVQEVVSELKKVTWPNRAETTKLTAVVIAISILVGVFIGGLDVLLVKVSTFLFQ